MTKHQTIQYMTLANMENKKKNKEKKKKKNRQLDSNEKNEINTEIKMQI